MSIKVVKPEDVGLAGDRLPRIDTHLLNRYLKPKKIAGAVTLVARRGEVAYVSPVGMMDLEQGKPMAEDTIFRIYSMTKPIATVALMMLYEQGHFQLGDRVDRFIPEWRDMEVFVSGEYPDFVTKKADRAMTIRDLLSHQSGLAADGRADSPLAAAYSKLKVRNRHGGSLK